MVNFLSKYSTIKNIITGIFLILFITLIAFPYFPRVFFGEIIPIKDLLDTQFGFSIEFVTTFLTSLNKNGRLAYKFTAICVDFPYLIIYSITYSLVFIKTFEINKINRFKTLALLPFGILFFDVLENLGIIHLINSFPNLSENSIYMTSIFNQAKWSFALANLILFLILVGIYLKQKSKHK